MGFYWTTLLYHGRLLSRPAYIRLTQVKGDLSSAVVKKVTKDEWILHAPGKYITMGSMDPVLNRQQKKAGKVSLRAVEKWLAQHDERLLKTTGVKSEWTSATQEQLQEIDSLIALTPHNNDEFQNQQKCNYRYKLACGSL